MVSFELWMFLGGFPEDFSILATIKTTRKAASFIFTIYDAVEAKEVLGLEVSNSTMLLYEDQNSLPGVHDYPRFNVDLADGKYAALWCLFYTRLKLKNGNIGCA